MVRERRFEPHRVAPLATFVPVFLIFFYHNSNTGVHWILGGNGMNPGGIYPNLSTCAPANDLVAGFSAREGYAKFPELMKVNLPRRFVLPMSRG